MSLQETKLLDSLTFCVLILKLAVHTLAVSYTAGVDLRFCLRFIRAKLLTVCSSHPQLHGSAAVCPSASSAVCGCAPGGGRDRAGRAEQAVISVSAFGTSQELEHPAADPHPPPPPNLERFYCSNGSPALPAMGGRASSLSIRFNYP